MSEWLTLRRIATRQWWTSLSSLSSDAILYASAALFSLGIGINSTANAQWHWGFLAVAPYAVAAVLAAACMRVSVRYETRVRVGLLSLVVVGAVLVPLVMEVHWRTEEPTRGFAQPEVPVIERAASDIVKFGTPYQSYWRHGRLVNPVPHIPSYESFFPYFPLMSVFGLPAVETRTSSPLSDARVVMTLMTMLTGGAALFLLRATRRQKIRVAQFLVALPTGALFLATGGDDMPILALSLLGIVALQRRANNMAGISLGLAAAMKLTAWPLALGALLVARGGDDRATWRRVALWIASIVLLTILPFAVSSPFAFLSNVVAFPLGLAHVASPAASPLPGHLLTELWGPVGHLLTPLTLLAGGYFAAKYARDHWPLNLSQLLAMMAAFSVVLICAASATRAGYVIYPLNFALWSRVCAEVPEPARELAGVSTV
ncbi:MAG TPA: glycosyltransferase family 87 protein [Acidimicrobiales bacterium]